MINLFEFNLKYQAWNKTYVYILPEIEKIIVAKAEEDKNFCTVQIKCLDAVKENEQWCFKGSPTDGEFNRCRYRQLNTYSKKTFILKAIKDTLKDQECHIM